MIAIGSLICCVYGKDSIILCMPIKMVTVTNWCIRNIGIKIIFRVNRITGPAIGIGLTIGHSSYRRGYYKTPKTVRLLALVVAKIRRYLVAEPAINRARICSCLSTGKKRGSADCNKGYKSQLKDFFIHLLCTQTAF